MLPLCYHPTPILPDPDKPPLIRNPAFEIRIGIRIGYSVRSQTFCHLLGGPEVTANLKNPCSYRCQNVDQDP